MTDEILQIPYAPMWHQYDFHMARREYHFRWLCTGVGAGKTVAACMEALILASEINPGSPGMIVVPDFATYSDVIKPVITEYWPQEMYEFTRSENRPAIDVKTPKGISKIYVRSAHNRQNVDKINGLTIAWAYLEEAGRFKCGELAWKYTLERLRYRAPYNGVYIAASPRPGWLPKTFNCTEGLPNEALEQGYSPQSDYWIRQAFTSWNKYNPDHYFERMKSSFGDGSFARQELYGSIEQATGLIYPEFSQGIHVIENELADGLTKNFKRKTCGVDWGWSNPGACIIGCWIEDGGTVVITDEWYHSGKQIEEQGYWGATNHRDAQVWYCDHEPRNIWTWKHGFKWKNKSCSLPAMAADKSWRAGTDSVRNLMHRRSGLDHPAYERGNKLGAPRFYIAKRCKNLIREYTELRDANDPDLDSSSQNREGFTIGDDHAIDATRYLVFNTLNKGRAKTSWQPR